MVEVLTRHFANDDLTEAELEARFQRVYAATSPHELDAIIADLPPLPASETLPIGAGRTTDSAIVLGFAEGFIGQQRGIPAQLEGEP